jgi:hypothetical protein
MPRTRTGYCRHFLVAALLFLSTSSLQHVRIVSFAEPIDALSLGNMEEGKEVQVKGLTSKGWIEGGIAKLENEHDPNLTESNLVMFPSGISAIRLEGEGVRDAVIHPIRVSDAPAGALIAARLPLIAPKILSRSEWGADEKLRLAKDKLKEETPPDTTKSDNGETAVSVRVKECNDAHRDYPAEFQIARTVEETPDGKKLSWPMEYSPAVRLLVVHHTALSVGSDTRSPLERMRALYQFHAVNRGWGDIGYHYVVDENGQIYEGRAGGQYVAGGHVYCGNVGTIGVSLMGNFDVEEPTQTQLKSLQWLLDLLSKQYSIDLGRNVVFHGRTMPPIVGHRGLVSTDCPGYALWESLSQIRRHVIDGNIDMDVRLPPPRTPVITNPRSSSAAVTLRGEGLSPIGSTELSGRPGSEILMGMIFRAGTHLYRPMTYLGEITASHRDIDVLMQSGESYAMLGHRFLLPEIVRPGSSLLLRLKVKLPMVEGNYTLSIGPVNYAVSVNGRRVRLSNAIPPKFQQSSSQKSTTPSQPSPSRRVQRPTISPLPTGEGRRSFESQGGEKSSTVIRIRLTGRPGTAAATAITIREPFTINGKAMMEGTILLEARRNGCAVMRGTEELMVDVPRIESSTGLIALDEFAGKPRIVRGVIECRSIGEELALINELPLEEYLRGLAEEPDTEPYEKQRAFAIAARTYALFYMDPANRKFPGMPYDGSDSPAIFQAYEGESFLDRNPRWRKAVESTAHQVLTKDGQVIKPPYFSSDDGRTRTPEEAGWKNFPFAEIFSSKPDPWCGGMKLAGHGVGMSGCGAKAQANEGRSAEEILKYYYPGTILRNATDLSR